jgi:hypothetical protein
MRLHILYCILIIVILLYLLLTYTIAPLKSIEFKAEQKNPNFTINGMANDMQFYKNLRFQKSEITYKISEKCPLDKANEAERAFKILSNMTILDFDKVLENEEISIYCDEQNEIKNGMFIAGEGGPENITQSGDFNVIFHSKVLLIKNSECANPNIALHEILHALGFGHSQNRKNILYNITKCNQEIGEDLISTINKLYEIPSYPDILIEDAFATQNKIYFDINVSLRNNGLRDSKEFKLKISSDGKTIKEIDIEPLKVGHGQIILLQNVLIRNTDVSQLKFSVVYEFGELDKENNNLIISE